MMLDTSRMTRSRHRAEAFQIEAQAGPGSGIPPAEMSQRVSPSEGEGLPLLYVAMSRAQKERTSVFASGLRIECAISSSRASQSGRSLQDRHLWCMIFIDRERHGVIEQTEARSWAAKMSPNGNSAAMHAAIERRRAGAE
jgi:hypothetical protein